VAVGDFNADGVPDLAVANYDASRTISVFLGNGDGTFLAARNFATGSELDPQFVAVGDFNGDGLSDLAVAQFSPPGGLSPDLGDGAPGDPGNVSVLINNTP
jgi:hypothetical protein